MFADESLKEDQEADETLEEAPEEGEESEEFVTGDIGPALVVRRACLAPQATEENWLRRNVFQSTCTIKGKICTFIVDSGCCENIIAAEAVKKLGLPLEKHPKPYKLSWLHNGGEVTVSKRARVPFSIGTRYQDELWCDVVEMDACHLLLGRPWQFDRAVHHDGRENTYSFIFNGVKIVLVPRRETNRETGSLLTRAQFEDELRSADVVFRVGDFRVGCPYPGPFPYWRVQQVVCPQDWSCWDPGKDQRQCLPPAATELHSYP